VKAYSSQTARSDSMAFVSPWIEDLGGKPFFGTILGLIREGAPLKSDDDVDFILPLDNRGRALDKILSLQGARLTLLTDWVIQFELNCGGDVTAVDLYFYTVESEDLRLPWHFLGTPWLANSHLLVPKKLLIDIVYVPLGRYEVKSAALAEYLYGPRWEQPLTKFIDYEIFIKENRPVAYFPGAFRRLARRSLQKTLEGPPWCKKLRFLPMLFALRPRNLLELVWHHRLNKSEGKSTSDLSEAGIAQLSSESQGMR